MAVEDTIRINFDGGDTAAQIKKIEKAFSDLSEGGLDRVAVKSIEFSKDWAILKATVEGYDASGNKIVSTLKQEGDALDEVSRKLVRNTAQLRENISAQDAAGANRAKQKQAAEALESSSKIAGIGRTLPEATPAELVTFQKAKEAYYQSLLAKGVGISTAEQAATKIREGEDPLQIRSGRDVGPEAQARTKSIAALVQYKEAYDNLGKTARQTGEIEKQVNEKKAAVLRQGLAEQKASMVAQGEAEEAARNRAILSAQKSFDKQRELRQREDEQRRADGERKQAQFLKEQAAAQTATKKIIDAQNTARDRLAARGTAETQLRQMFPVPSTASISQINLYERNIQRILTLVEKGKIDLATFNRLLQGGGAGARPPGGGLPGLPTPGGTGDEAKIVNSLSQLKTAFNTTGEAGVGSARGILLSWQSVVRLFEVQVLHQVLTRFIVQLESSINKAKEFYIKIAEIETIQGNAKLSTDQWADALNKLAGKFGFSQIDVASAAYETLSANVGKGKQALDFLDTSLEFARVTNSTAKESVDLLSSAINSFGLQSKDAKDVAEQFFKSIESGRIRTSQIADIFGRVGVSASLLGVKFNELNAAITTLSVKGIRPAEVFTLLNNVFTKLSKPTEEMQTLFDKWGVSSGEAAVKTFGFAEVLRKLAQEAKDGNVKVSELFNEIRSFRGGSGLLASLKEFETNLAAPSTYREQALSTEQKNIQYLRSEVEKLEISFVKVGVSINDYFVRGSKAIGGISNAVDNFTSVLGKAIPIGVTFGATLLSFRFIESGAAFDLLLTGLGKISNVGSLANLSMTALKGTLNSLSSPTGILAVSTAAYLLADALINAKRNADEARESLISAMEAQASKYEKAVADSSNIKIINAQIDEVQKQSLGNIAKLRAAAKEVFDIFKEAQVASFENLKLTTSAFLDTLQDAVNKTKERIREIDSETKRSIKTIDDLGRKLKSDVFEINLQEKLEGIRNKPNFRETDIDYKFINGQLVRFKERQHADAQANEQAKEQNRILAERTEITERIKHASEELDEVRKERNKVLADPNGPDKEKLGQVRQEYGEIYNQLKSIANLQTKLGPSSSVIDAMRTLIGEAQNLEKEYQKALVADEKRQKIKLEEEQKRLRLAKDIIKQILELEGLGDPASKINEKFKTPEEGLKHLLDLSKQLIAVSDKAGIGADKQLQLGLSLIDSINKARASVGAGTGGILGDLDKQENQINNVSKAMKEQAKAADDAKDAALRQVDANKIAAKDIATQLKIAQPNIFQEALYPGLHPELNRIKLDLQSIIDKVPEIGKNTPREKINELVNLVIRAKEEYIKFADAGKIQPSIKQEQIDKYNRLETVLRNLSVAQGQFNAQTNALNNMQSKLSNALNPGNVKELQGEFGNLGLRGNTAATNIKEGFDVLNKTLRETESTVQNISEKLAAINAQKAAAAVPNVTEPGKQQGGIIGGLDPGNKKDDLFTPTSRGEFVVNSDSTAKFYNQLNAMNQGIDPTNKFTTNYYQNVQPVASPINNNNNTTNNTADNIVHLNVTLQPKSINQDDVRELGARLRREIQRGTVVLS